MRAAIYTRQSLDKTGNGLAVARQLAEGERLCEMRGYEIVSRQSDNDMSGYSAKPRPGYQEIIALMVAGAIDIVVCWAVDRLTRRLADLTELIDLCEQTGVKVATVSGDLDLSTASGKLMARILGSVAQGEVETKSARQKLANRQAAEAGRTRKGTPRPFGWQADRLTLDEAEADAIRAACASLLAKGTITGVCRDWEARGLRPHQVPFGPLTEHPWTTTSVRLILRNPRNAALAVYAGEEVGRGEWEPVVPEETFRAVAELLADTSRKPTQGVRSLLGCLALCCCGNFVGGARGANGQPSYRCHQPTRGERPGPHVFVRRPDVDAHVGELAVWRLAKRDAVSLVVTSEAAGDAAALREEAAVIRAKLARLGALFIAGTITEQDLISGRKEGEARLGQIGDELARLGRESVLSPLVSAAEAAGDDEDKRRDAVRRAWKALGTDRQRAVIDALMTVTLRPSGRGARKFDAAKVIGIEWKR